MRISILSEPVIVRFGLKSRSLSAIDSVRASDNLNHRRMVFQSYVCTHFFSGKKIVNKIFQKSQFDQSNHFFTCGRLKLKRSIEAHILKLLDCVASAADRIQKAAYNKSSP